MSAKSKKRLCKLENKLLKLEKLELKDVLCPICQSIFIEPVTLPCFHNFCQRCFNGSIENNALCCPLCRLRIGSWLRTATKQNNLVNIELWESIQSKFSGEIDTKLKGEDLVLPDEKSVRRISAPGEIRSEYEAELQRLRAERLEQEKNHIKETELLIKKIQEEEQEAQRQYLERLKQDELLAKEIQKKESKSKTKKPQRKHRKSLRETIVRPKLKTTKIDGYLAKIQAPLTVPLESPLLTDDNTSTDGSTQRSANRSENGADEASKSVKGDTGSSTSSTITSLDSSSLKSASVSSNQSCPNTSKPTSTTNAKLNITLSPELIPSFSKHLNNILDKKIKASTFWNKENGNNDVKEQIKEKDPPPPPPHSEVDNEDMKEKKSSTKSLLVSLPLPNCGVLHSKSLIQKPADSDSVDSMHQELCFFKPIEKTSPTSLKSSRKLPVRVACVRAAGHAAPQPPHQPSRAQFLDSLCRLRHLSLAKNLPSAFVLVLSALKNMKNCAAAPDDNAALHDIETKQSTKRNRTNGIQTSIAKRVMPNKKLSRVPNNTRLNSKTTLRRTRSMGSIKDENETTPKKIKAAHRKVVSDRKPHLRSDSKKLNARKELESPPLMTKIVNNNKISLAVKNLSSPLKNCDVKKIVQEQLRIEKIIEQEKKDLEIARKMDAEWNGRRQLRRAPAKRQVTLNYALRPAKKVKV